MDSISPAVLRKVTRELYALENDPPEGIRLIMNEDSITDIQAWIQGPEGTPYEGGCFRIRIQLSADFPNAPPKCFFITKIFHPNVSKQGDICVSTLKKDWKKDLGLRHILLVIKCLLIFPNPESALNEEAGRQLLEHYDDYAKHACLLTSIHAAPMRQDIFQSHRGEDQSIAGNADSASNTGRGAGLQQDSRTVRGKSPAVAEGSKDLNPPGSIERQRLVFATQSIPGTVACVENMQFTPGQHPRPTMNKPSFHHNQQQQYHTTQQIPKLAPSLIGQPCKEDIQYGGTAIFNNATGVITKEGPALLQKAVPRLVHTGTPSTLSSRLLTRHSLDSQTHVAKKRALRRL